MDKRGIINFSKFYSDIKEGRKPFNKEDFLNEVKESENLKPLTKKVKESVKKDEETVEYPEVVSEIIEEPAVQDVFEPPVNPESFVIEEPKEISKEEEEEKEIESIPSLTNKNNFNQVEENYYPVYKDKFENFTCNVSVEGAKLNNTKARLILESDDWNLVFDGDIDQYGKCTIPIKKLSVLDEGTVGKIRLEVIAENTIFSPWQDEFKVRLSKKVEVLVPKKEIPQEPSVQIKFDKE